MNLLPTLLPADASGSLALHSTQVLAMPLPLQNQSSLLMQPQPQSAANATPELSLQQLTSNPFMQMAAVPQSAGASSNMLLSSFNSLVPGTRSFALDLHSTVYTGYREHLFRSALYLTYIKSTRNLVVNCDRSPNSNKIHSNLDLGTSEGP